MSIIHVEGLNKSFKVFFDKGHSLKEKMLFRNRSRYETRAILKDISFRVERGEAVGLIGENGSGKSTMLKILNRILYPEKGLVKVDGRISSLIELGAGFHPDMSGRENIYTNASIFGLTKKEVDDRLSDIIRFSELEKFIDNPVRTYSSGMYMRLAFSVAINVNADVLLIDEILAVGDTNFNAKCYKKLNDLKENGVTIIIVSHDLGSIRRLCSRALWLNDGVIAADGDVFEITDRYLMHMADKKKERLRIEAMETNQQTEEEENAVNSTIAPDLMSWGDKSIVFKDILVGDTEHRRRNAVVANQPFFIELGFSINKPAARYCIELGISGEDGHLIFGTTTDNDGFDLGNINNYSRVKFIVHHNFLKTGTYKISATISDGGENVYDHYPVILSFAVSNEDSFKGDCYFPHNWEHEQI